MDRARPQAQQGLTVGRGSIADMLIEAPTGMLRRQAGHLAVPRDLGNDRCGGNGGTGRIALDEAAVLDLTVRQLEAVDKADRLPGAKLRQGQT